MFSLCTYAVAEDPEIEHVVTICAEAQMIGNSAIKNQSKFICEHALTGKIAGYNALLNLTSQCRALCEPLNCQWSLDPEVSAVVRHSSDTCSGPTRERRWIRTGWTDQSKCTCQQVNMPALGGDDWIFEPKSKLASRSCAHITAPSSQMGLWPPTNSTLKHRYSFYLKDLSHITTRGKQGRVTWCHNASRFGLKFCLTWIEVYPVFQTGRLGAIFNDFMLLFSVPQRYRIFGLELIWEFDVCV